MTICFLVFFFAFQQLGGFEFGARAAQRSALARPGLHHADIRGRFVDPEGTPVAGVRVQLHTEQARSLPVREAVSDSEGRFSLEDANTAAHPGLLWFPPERWLKGRFSLPDASFEDVDLGEIRLRAATTLRLAVELIGGEPLDDSWPSNPSIALEALPWGPRKVAHEVGDIWVIEGISFREARWDVTIHAKDRKWEQFSGDFQVPQGSRDRFLLLRLDRNALEDGAGVVEVHEALGPEVEIEQEFRAHGRLVAADGSPVAGALVTVNDFLDRVAPGWTSTDAAGEFELRYRSTECRSLQIQVTGGGYAQPADKSKEVGCEELWLSGRTETLSSLTRLMVSPRGVDPNGLRSFWWSSALGWRPLPSLRPWIVLPRWKQPMFLRFDSPGFLAQVQRIELSAGDGPEGEKPSDPLEVGFQFDRSGVRELEVMSDGLPVAGAIVDVEWIQDLIRERRIPLAAYRTDSGGKLRLAGASAQLVEVFVYAETFEPARAVWEPGRPLRLELVPRTARLSLRGLWPGYRARVIRVGQPEAVRASQADVGTDRSLELAAGTYDVLVYNTTGQVGYQRVTVGPGEVRDLNAAVDRRPRLIVRYTEPGWTADVGESTPAGTAVGWVAYSTAGGGFATADVVAQLESESQTESAFRLSRAGRFQINLHRRDYEHSLWREIEIGPGEEISLDAPTTASTLRGSMRSYDGGTGFSHHGWAGPRLQLVSDDPRGWSVTVYLPTRESEHSFALSGLPDGRFHLHQHLIGMPTTYQSLGKEIRTTRPLDAWGGIPVMLKAGQTTTLQDFIDYPYQDLEVSVLDPDGRPLEGATLRVRDRMSEAWRQVEEAPTSLSNAAHPIPYPPAVRLKNGRATLPSIRAGRLELFVELDDGRVHSVRADIDPTRPLTIQIPDGGSR